MKSQGCGKRKTVVKRRSGKRSGGRTITYYKWSWAWYLKHNQCTRYTKAVAEYNKRLRAYSKANKKNKKAAYNAFKKAKAQKKAA